MTVSNWIRAFGEEIKAIVETSHSNIELVELDEMYTYIESKKVLEMDCC